MAPIQPGEVRRRRVRPLIRPNRGLWYIAAPYAKVADKDSNILTVEVFLAQLMANGISAYAPTYIGHQLRIGFQQFDHLPHQEWMELDKPFLYASSGLVVLMLQGWEESEGIFLEREWMRLLQRPVLFASPGEPLATVNAILNFEGRPVVPVA